MSNLLDQELACNSLDGEGYAGIEILVSKLKQMGYTGPLTIERETTGEEQNKDILKAKQLLEKLR